MTSDGAATCPCLWMDGDPCARCGRVPSDFYDSDAEELAHEIVMELYYFSQDRPRRELQAARLWENEEGWVSTIWLAGRCGESFPNYLGMLKRMQRQAGLRRRFPKFQKV